MNRTYPAWEVRGTGWLRRRQALLAAGLLLTRAAMAAANGGHAASSLAVTACAAALGGCLWWVTRRQVGPWPGLLALALFLLSPVWHATDAVVALLLFVLLYTATGVAHAVQGPRHKWPPRLVLLMVLAAALGLLFPWAAALGLGLGYGCMLYLGHNRRRLLTGILAVSLALAAIASMARPTEWGWLAGAGRPQPAGGWLPWAGDLLALAFALALWAVHRRSRFFGNTAPLLAAAACMAAARPVWAMPMALLFTAGVFGDGLEAPSGRLRAVSAVYAVGCMAAQLLVVLMVQ